MSEQVEIINKDGKTYRIIQGDSYIIEELLEEVNIPINENNNNKNITIEELNSKIDDLTLLILSHQGVIEP